MLGHRPPSICGVKANNKLLRRRPDGLTNWRFSLRQPPGTLRVSWGTQWTPSSSFEDLPQSGRSWSTLSSQIPLMVHSEKVGYLGFFVVTDSCLSICLLLLCRFSFSLQPHHSKAALPQWWRPERCCQSSDEAAGHLSTGHQHHLHRTDPRLGRDRVAVISHLKSRGQKSAEGFSPIAQVLPWPRPNQASWQWMTALRWEG